MSHLFSFCDIVMKFDIGKQPLMVSGFVNAGDVLVVTGPSGAGKSTLLRILCRLIAPAEGTMYLQGIEARQIMPQEWRRRVHYVPQKPALFEGTVEENLHRPFALSAVSKEIVFDRNAAVQYLKAMDLSPQIMEQRAFTLSGGEAARVALLRTLLLQPQILLLDEPTAALDDETRRSVMSIVSRWVEETNDRAIIMVSHNRDDLSELPGVRKIMIQGTVLTSQTKQNLTMSKGEADGL
ncbi:MAG: ATP-binding cassette domain-containing protein [Bacillota bacterium]|nr:ATP-binding cassette domain-containing protein [Bacillota bacterium]